MSWEDRFDATISVMTCIIAVAAVLLALLIVLALAPGVLLFVTAFVGFAFGLTYVPQLFRWARKKWENRK